MYAYNTSVNDSAIFNPFELMFGCKAFLPIDIEIDNKSPEELLNQLFKEKDNTQNVQAVTDHRLEIFQITQNNIKLKDIFL